METSVYSRWVKDRVINAQATAITEKIATLEDDFDDDKGDEVTKAIPRLQTEPEVAFNILQSSTHGCSYLIDRLTALSQWVKTHNSVEVSDRGQALRLTGHRPDELFSDPEVFAFNRSYFASLNGPGGFTAEGAANALLHDKPARMSLGEFVEQCRPLVCNLVSMEQGRAEVYAFIEKAIKRLEEREELVGYREERVLECGAWRPR